MLSEETQQAKFICCRLRVLSWVAHLAGSRVGVKFYDMFLVLLGASCQYKVMCKSTQTSKKQAEQPHSFESGEMAVTLPTAALSGCGFGSLKRVET